MDERLGEGVITIAKQENPEIAAAIDNRRQEEMKGNTHENFTVSELLAAEGGT